MAWSSEGSSSIDRTDMGCVEQQRWTHSATEANHLVSFPGIRCITAQ